MNYVILRCARCNRKLVRVEAVEPDEWKETVYVPRCRKHDMPGPGQIVDYMIQRDSEGVPLGGEMPLYAIREEIGKAHAKGKDVGVAVRFSEQDDGLHLHLK